MSGGGRWPEAKRPAWPPASSASALTKSTRSWMCTTLPQANTPSREVSIVLDTTGPDVVTGSSRNRSSRRQLVLGDQADRHQQRVARDVPGLGEHRREVVVDGGDGDLARSDRGRGSRRRWWTGAAGCRSRGGTARRCGSGRWRRASSSNTPGHLDPFEGEPAGHDQPDVARAEDDDPPAGQDAVEVDEPLGRAGGEDAGRSSDRECGWRLGFARVRPSPARWPGCRSVTGRGRPKAP